MKFKLCVLIYCISFVACDDQSSNSESETAGETADRLAGETTSRSAGESSGGMTGETAGEIADTMPSEQAGEQVVFDFSLRT